MVVVSGRCRCHIKVKRVAVDIISWQVCCHGVPYEILEELLVDTVVETRVCSTTRHTTSKKGLFRGRVLLQVCCMANPNAITRMRARMHVHTVYPFTKARAGGSPSGGSWHVRKGAKQTLQCEKPSRNYRSTQYPEHQTHEKNMYNLSGFAVGAPTLSKSVTMPPGIEISLEETTKALHCIHNQAWCLTLC